MRIILRSINCSYTVLSRLNPYINMNKFTSIWHLTKYFLFLIWFKLIQKGIWKSNEKCRIRGWEKILPQAFFYLSIDRIQVKFCVHLSEAWAKITTKIGEKMWKVMTILFTTNWQALGFTLLAVFSALRGQLIIWSKVGYFTG